MDRSPLSAPRLLVGTNNRELGRHLGKVLNEFRYFVQLVEDGHEALRILLGPNPPEIVLLDSSLPGQNGLELAAELKRHPGKKQTWIMLLSSAADPATVAAAADAGVDDLLLCPVNEADLRVRLGVAGRVQELTRRPDLQTRAVSFHASHDHLTGLWNRESLLSLLFPETDRVQRIGTPLGFLMLDLDHFASINTDYGYEAGDKILQELANRLRRYLRSYDLIGRCGEDEFLIVLPGCNSAQALNLASRIRTVLLHRPFAAGRDMAMLTASIGVAQSRGRSPLVVLRETERALAYAKREGRNCEREYVPPTQIQNAWENQSA
ncbi:MAG: GGDEF domain-containing response regulator [Silvibacterium sp.]